MNYEVRQIQRALGEENFSVDALAENDSLAFRYFRVRLPAKYRGLPPIWDFAVLKADAQPSDAVPDAERIVDRQPGDNLLVLVSGDPRVHLNDEIHPALSKKKVFCLDAQDLKQQGKKKDANLHLRPLPQAIRRRVAASEGPAYFLTPYQRNSPVTGWRFFGRKRQLSQLVETSESFIIVGARRVGKTSLMMEAYNELLERGEQAYFVDVQACETPAEVTREILQTLSSREVYQAKRHSQALGEDLLSTLLRRLGSKKRRATLFLDEIGNVIAKLGKEDWSFIGTLRRLSQQGYLRIVLSCFQEIFLRQQTEFTGPLINLASTMRLGVFGDSEVEDILYGPIEIWRPISQYRAELKKLVLDRVGSHPFILQYFCYALFERFSEDSADLMECAHSILGRDIGESFGDAIRQTIRASQVATPLFLFLRFCKEAEEAGSIRARELNDRWVERALLELGYRSTSIARLNLLGELEIRGLTTRPTSQSDADRQVVATPLVYYYFRATEPDLKTLIARYRDEVELEEDIWGLTKISATG